MMVPNILLKSLYTTGSLRNGIEGTRFMLKNRLRDAELTGLPGIVIDGQPVAKQRIRLELGDGRIVTAAEVSVAHPIAFPLRAMVTILTDAALAGTKRHEIEIHFEARPFGKFKLKVEDEVSEEPAGAATRGIPRDRADDYTAEAIGRRLDFVEKTTGLKLHHVAKSSFDPRQAKGNCENFIGVAQVPIGVAGPLQVHGEHADGEFLIPLATTEGTLVASYSRGMKVLNLCGGVQVTVTGDAMQRAPVFVFHDARAAREFGDWVQAHLEQIRHEAEATSAVAKLQYIDPYLANKFVYLRFNFSTGDAAGQNMVGKATLAACNWILENYEGVTNFYLESNLATDKKASQINTMHTRGKRVTAEATLSREALVRHLRVEPEKLSYHYGVSNVGAFLSGANNNGAQAANAITAMFIATGQDVANVAESSAGVLYSELTSDGGLYISLTIPSLIVATYGGGTGLPTQRECLEMLGCYGKGKVRRLAEIIAGVALAGEISLGAAISSSDWVSGHEKYGRNR